MIKKLWEVTIWDKRFKGVDKEKQKQVNRIKQYTFKQLKEIKEKHIDYFHDIKLLMANKLEWWLPYISGLIDFYLDEVVYIPSGGQSDTVVPKYYNGFFVASNVHICKSFDEEILKTEFLYHWFLSNWHKISRFYIGTVMPKVKMDLVLELEIEIPPLDEQMKRLEFLDKLNGYHQAIVQSLKCNEQRFKKLFKIRSN